MHVLRRFDIMYFNLKYRKQGKYFPPFALFVSGRI